MSNELFSTTPPPAPSLKQNEEKLCFLGQKSIDKSPKYECDMISDKFKYDISQKS